VTARTVPAAGLLVAAVLGTAAPAAADPDPPGWGHGEDVVTPGTPGGGTGGGNGNGNGDGDATEVSATPIGYPHYSLALRDLDDGDRCWGIGVERRDEPQNTGRTLDEIRATAPTASGSPPIIERTSSVPIPVGQVQSVRTD
jgi:hypothetical protein